LKPDFGNILPELKAIPHWVLAKVAIRNGKVTKPPYQPNGNPASHSDPATWSSFSAVKQAYEDGGYIGVGFVLDGKPHFNWLYLHGLDWDHCIEGVVLKAKTFSLRGTNNNAHSNDLRFPCDCTDRAGQHPDYVDGGSAVDKLARWPPQAEWQI
jgi:hypothetical protein